jgi:amidase
MWPALVTVANLPATVRPIGLDADGLPLGVQMVGPYLHDRTPIRFATLCDEAFGAYQVAPL